MASTDSYRDRLKKDLGELVDALGLSTLQKHFLRSRWLDQVLWLEGKSAETQRLYYVLRLTSIVGGVIVPTLVAAGLKGLPAVLSLVVAVSAAVEEFFKYGERWRHYRRTAELLKIEGWQFLQRCGSYAGQPTDAEAYGVFAAKVEEILRQEVDVFVTQVAGEPQKPKNDAAR